MKQLIFQALQKRKKTFFCLDIKNVKTCKTRFTFFSVYSEKFIHQNVYLTWIRKCAQKARTNLHFLFSSSFQPLTLSQWVVSHRILNVNKVAALSSPWWKWKKKLSFLPPQSVYWLLFFLFSKMNISWGRGNSIKCEKQHHFLLPLFHLIYFLSSLLIGHCHGNWSQKMSLF